MFNSNASASRKVNGKSVIASLVAEKMERNNRKAAAAGTSMLALILSACGGGSSSSSTKLTLSKTGENYTSTAVNGFTLTDSSVAKYDIANATSNSYKIDLNADGAGVLEFDFADAGDTVTLNSGSKVTGFTTLKVTDGTLDATNADLSSITRVEVASGIKISLAQVKNIPTIVANSSTSEITIEVASEAEATELVSLLSAGTVKVYGDTNPIKMVATETATVTTETLTAKVAETTASVKTKAEAPADTSTTTTETTTTTSSGTSAAAVFAVSDEGSGAYTVDSGYGLVTVTSANSRYVFDPADGASVSRLISDVNSLSVAGSLTGAAAVLDGETISGTGSVSITALEGDAAADLSNITVSGTKTIAVTDDVTFTGDLGSGFATTVSSGKTMTASAAIVAGQNIDGAGNLTITGGATVDTDLTDIDVTGTLSFDSNTIAITSGKTLTLDAVQAAQATSGISGSGNLTISDDAGAANSTIKSTVDSTGVKTIDAGTGNDTIDLGEAANIDNDDSIDGGGGTDVLKITADGDSTGAVLEDLVDIDTITMVADGNDTAKVTIQYTSANTDVLTINASAMSGGVANFTLVANDAEADGAYTVTGTAGNDTFYLGAGNDTVEGGAGVDAFYMNDTSTEDTIVFNSVKGTSSDSVRVAGGSNNDTGQDTIADLEATDTILVKITNVDDFEHADDVAIGTATGGTVDGTVAGSFLATVALIDVDGGTGFDDNDDIIINLSSADATINNDALLEAYIKYELTADADGATMTGGSKADTITGGAGDDTIKGGDGADTIAGAAGNDSITGEGGADAINLGGASGGTDTVKYTATGQTFAGLVTSGSTALTGIDVITGAGAGDKVDLSSSSLGSSVDYVAHGSVGTAVLDGSASAGAVALVQGTYDSSTGVFTAGTGSANDDYLLNYATAATSSATASEAIVLMDITGTVSLTESSDVYTIGVA